MTSPQSRRLSAATSRRQVVPAPRGPGLRGLRVALPLAFFLGACAAPAPSPRIEPTEAPTSTSRPVPELPKSPGEEITELVESGDLGAARELFASVPDDAWSSPAEHDLVAARLLAAEARAGVPRATLEESLVQYYRISGVEGGAELAPKAFDEIAEIREERGNSAESLRARLIAWDRSDEEGRKTRAGGLRRAAESADERTLRRLVRDPGIGAAAGFLWIEIAERDAAAGRAASARRAARRVLDSPDPRIREIGARVLREEPDEGAAEEFTIALLAPLQGRFEMFGRSFLLGARIALADRNQGDSAARLSIRLAVRDTEGDLLTAMRAARDAVFEDGADAIVGPLLSVTSIAAGGIAQTLGVPLITPIATDPRLSEIGPAVQTLAPDPEELAVPLAEFSMNELGYRSFGVLVPRDGMSAEFEAKFRSAVEERGGRVSISIAFDPEDSDFRHLIERIDEAGVDAVYVPGGVASLERLAPQLDFYEFGRRLLGNGGWMDSRILDPGNIALDGAVFAVESADNPDSEFRIRLRDAIWEETRGEVSRFHVQGYRAMAALLFTIDAGARSGEEIVQTLCRRRHWPVRPESEQVELLTYRDGVLGPATWAPVFELEPKIRDEPEEGSETREPETHEGETDRADPAEAGGSSKESRSRRR
jgi:branched-chain amino acid transport system substrate-binding protein